MVRKPRNDSPGTWHHAMNRAIARRPIFETREDVRYFLAGVARSVRRGQLEVHAWCVMTTHFHMLVRSPIGELSEAMHRIQNAFTRYFNRKRRRDGPLFRGRFLSNPVESSAYRRILVNYIDANPVRAGLCTDPCRYPWGSARQYVESTGPRWLHRQWVEELVSERSPTGRFDPSSYPRSTDERQRDVFAHLVQARLESSSTTDELDSLLAMAPPAIRAWLRRKAVLADGAPPPFPCVAATVITDSIAESAIQHGTWIVRPNRAQVDGWSTLHAGLLRGLANESMVGVAHRVKVSAVQAKRLVTRHRELLLTSDLYSNRAAEITHTILNVLCQAQI